MDVVEVSDTQQLELKPNCVYVIAPDRKLEISDTTIARFAIRRAARPACADRRLLPLARRESRRRFCRHPVGRRFRRRRRCKGGKGSRRSGPRAGSREAAHEAMPRAVIAANIADLVLPVRELAAGSGELAPYKEKLASLVGRAKLIDGDDETVLKRIFELVRARTGHDFTRYKRPTLMRRLARRMQLNHRSDLEQYLGFLRENPNGSAGVVRRPADFGDDILPRSRRVGGASRPGRSSPLVERVQPDEPIRVWVPGCATGEEAYTLAILFREEIGRRDLPCELVIFGSDVDQSALATAREGIYPLSIAADVVRCASGAIFPQRGRPLSRRERNPRLRRVRRAQRLARSAVLETAPHFVSQPDDLSRSRPANQLQNVFRYGLRDDGVLFIGVSETADADLFEPIDKQQRVYRPRTRLGGPPVRLPQLPAVPQSSANIERVRERATRMRRSGSEMHVEALEDLAPPSVLVDEHWNVMHLSESAGRYMLPRGGPPTHTLTDLVRPELLDELRTTLHRAYESHEPMLSSFVPVQVDGAAQLVAVLAHPRIRTDTREAHLLVTFLDGGKATSAIERRTQRDDRHDRPAAARQAAHRGTAARRMRQDHSTAYEDLRAANEELQSLNEEYRSTAEELETSKEELQSVNEELQTVNHELKLKLEEVSRANNDLENFMAATDIPTLFLDRNLCITRYTAPLRQIFNVKPHDRGRPISDLRAASCMQIWRTTRPSVLEDLVPVERVIESGDGSNSSCGFARIARARTRSTASSSPYEMSAEQHRLARNLYRACVIPRTRGMSRKRDRRRVGPRD